MKTHEVQIEGFTKPVIIWKLNNGFKTDLLEKTVTITLKTDPKTGKERPQAMPNTGASRTYNLVYGILESEDLGVSRPDNVLSGLTAMEEKQRLQIVRGMESEIADEILKAITELNNPRTQEEIDEIQKKSTPSQQDTQ